MIAVDSSSDLVSAAWQWLQVELKGRPPGPLVVLIGAGDGSAIDAIERYAPATRVLALEPDPASTRRVLARRDRDAWLGNGRWIYLADPDYAGFNEAWRLFPTDGGQPIILTHPELVRCEGIGRAKEVLKRILFGVQANAIARRRMAPTYLTNSIRNVPAMLRGTDLRALTDAYRGVPAVIVGAGPSLDASLEPLKAVGDRALVIATDTALRPLLGAGIAPPLVVGMDPNAVNLRHFLSLPECRHTWLVAESALDPNAVAAFEDRTFWFRLAHHHPWPWLNEIGVDVGRLDVWGSVLTGAFQAACLAGCDPIVLVGADLAYTGGRPYARGTTYEFDWALGVAHGVDLSRSWAIQMGSGSAQDALDLRGVPTPTTEVLLSFRDWIVARATQSGRRVVNAGGAGILTGAGIEHLSLHQVLGDDVAIAPVASFARPLSSPQPAGLANHLRRLRDAMAMEQPLQAPTSPLAHWAAFCGDGFTPAAVGAALDAAVDGLEHGGKAPAVWRHFWTRCLGHELTRDTLVQLPEALRQLRSGLSGINTLQAIEPALDTRQRTAILRETLHLLNEIRTAVVQAEDVAPIGDPASPGDRTVSAAYAWPETTRWAILTFEALLGRTCTSPLRLSRSIFGGAVRFIGLAKTVVEHDEPPLAVQACTTLAEQWLRCVAELDRQDAAILRGMLVPSMVTTVMPAAVNAADRARLLTGTLRTSAHADRAGSASLLTRPRVLTDEGVDRSMVLYETADGAVCLTPHTTETFILREDGSRGPAHAWPHSISGELPWGVDGAVAWSSGFAHPSHVSPPYVMFRRNASDEPIVEELPVRPAAGTWLDGRLYWICLPGPGEKWKGIASWVPGTPGGGTVLELSDEVPIDIHASDGDLLLEPCVRRANYSLKRRLVSRGQRWRPTGQLEPRALGPYGASSSRSSRHGWDAVAHPEADAVRLVSSSGVELALNCYYPFKLAWIGRSLLVRTIERELLLFEDLVGALEQWR